MDKKKDYMLPVSILIAAVLITGALIYNANSGDSDEPSLAANVEEVADLPSSPAASKIKPVTTDDHLIGNSDAPIKIVEFSDTECPFCKRFHLTMKQIVAEYSDRVAWVYRHYPLDSLHSKARKEAEATECAWELGGNEGFWKYIDKIYEITPSNDALDLNLLPEVAEEIGLDRTKFEECLNDGEYASKVSAHLKDAENSGGRGTPYSVMIVGGDQYVPINGAQPYEAVKLAIEQALESLAQER